jgi:hypothetical protein
MSATNNWKNNEKYFPKCLAKYGVDAERISRAGNYAESIHDMRVHGFHELKDRC